MIFSSVVLPAPEGAVIAVIVPVSSLNAMSARTSFPTPDALRKDLRVIAISIATGTPPLRCSSFKGLHHPCLDHQHDGHEG